MRYLPHTPEEIESMLDAVGKSSLDELFESIPDAAKQKQPLDMAPALDEHSLKVHVSQLAKQNAAAEMLSFIGCGAYNHHFPVAADQLLLRSEFYTAYTPYQAEVAQGTLQVIFEFQTIVSEVLGLPVANASMYDASTGVAEAVLMARRLTKRDRMVVSGCVHPQYTATIETYVREIDHDDPSLVKVPMTADATTDVAALAASLDEQTACVVVGYPSYLGTVVDLKPLAAAAASKGVKLITATAEPFALAVLESPGAIGADIAVAEGQPLGLPPQYGGPGVGLFACGSERKTLQQMPGRLAGETVDKDGKRGYVLTLATREQHIRRERATSNICTNSGLCATALTIKMCMLGKKGFVEVAELCLAKTQYLRDKLAAVEGYPAISQAPCFNELAVEVPGGDAGKLVTALAEDGILAGLDLARLDPARRGQLLISVTEKHSRTQLDRLIAALAAYRP